MKNEEEEKKKMDVVRSMRVLVYLFRLVQSRFGHLKKIDSQMFQQAQVNKLDTTYFKIKPLKDNHDSLTECTLGR